METILLAQVFGALFGFTGVLLGAFGAHRLKGKLSEERLQSFETGVRYQLLHALLLLMLSFNLSFTAPVETWLVRLLVLGVLLFSGSIYGLVFSGHQGRKWKFLGPVTPVGGLLLLAAWGMLGYAFLANLF
ncbi:DUF423 domain-containing protein [Robiginitalea sp. M366]|uniref:DUF423 domain-containing protein n=1 Tax=Robiginitalea aestuariiviva TaxID=3036903 RepID=UPI00240E524A|nr:DUF423 domain-containing protein [Robiginitalea aestuariiviva]MDG1571283.1 DUF423 domain-containing protein [Robiginitalea aestuariiviva]